MAEINAQSLIGNDGVLQLDDAAIFDRLILRDGSDLVLRDPSGASSDIKISGYFDLRPDILTASGHEFDFDWVVNLARPAAPGALDGLVYAQSAVAEVIGTIVEFGGQGTVIRVDGTREPISNTLTVRMGDVVETQGDTNVLIEFIDKTRFSLGPDTKFTLDEFVFDPGTKAGTWGSQW